MYKERDSIENDCLIDCQTITKLSILLITFLFWFFWWARKSSNRNWKLKKRRAEKRKNKQWPDRRVVLPLERSLWKQGKTIDVYELVIHGNNTHSKEQKLIGKQRLTKRVCLNKTWKIRNKSQSDCRLNKISGNPAKKQEINFKFWTNIFRKRFSGHISTTTSNQRSKHIKPLCGISD